MKIYIELDAPDDFRASLCMQPYIEAEIAADRWAWYPELKQRTGIQRDEGG